MNILNINNNFNKTSLLSTKSNIINQNQFVFNKLERTPNKDTVSFSGHKPIQKKLCPNVQSALEYSQEIINLKNDEINLENIAKITQKYSQDAIIHPMSELQEYIDNSENYGAFFLSKLDENSRPITKEMFLEIPKGKIDDFKKYFFASSCAHEFTHLNQIEAGEKYELLKTLAKGDVDYMKGIMSIGDAIFKLFDNEIQASFVKPIIENRINYFLFDKYGEIPPQESAMSMQIFINESGYEKENELKQNLKQTYYTIFNNAFNQVQKQPEILDLIPKNESKEQLMKKVMAFCALCAKNEKEAYLTEAEIARKILNTEKSLNLDAFVLYYDILTKSLEK